MASASNTTVAMDSEKAEAPNPNASEKPTLDEFLVVLEDKDNPQKMSTFRKWIIVAIISCAAFCVTCLSSVVSFSQGDIVWRY